MAITGVDGGGSSAPYTSLGQRLREAGEGGLLSDANEKRRKELQAKAEISGKLQANQAATREATEINNVEAVAAVGEEAGMSASGKYGSGPKVTPKIAALDDTSRAIHNNIKKRV